MAVRGTAANPFDGRTTERLACSLIRPVTLFGGELPQPRETLFVYPNKVLESIQYLELRFYYIFGDLSFRLKPK